MKTCTKCTTNKPFDQFRIRFTHKDINSIGRYSSWCKQCYSEYEKETWKSQKPRRGKIKQESRKIIWDRNRQFIFEYLSCHPCVDCSEPDPIVLEFDHVDRNKKEYEISRMIKSYSVESIQQEISKCVVRCANCHRRKTAHEFNWHKSRNGQG